jgi:dephospho-CoA kinase
VRRAVVERFGADVLDEQGEIDRGKVGEIVFADREELDFLEGLLHPRVVSAYLAWRDELGARPDPPAVCATEVPLLYETGGETRFDTVVAIGASPQVRIRRTIVPDFTAREQRLMPDEEKMQRADFAYVNDGTLEELDAFVAEVVATLSR